jgi:hypothetical protein
LQGGAIVSPTKCDAAGNIYVRFDQPKVFAAPVVKISSDGEKKAVFSLESAKDWETGEFYDFAVRSDGSLYLLAARWGKGREIERAILSFDEQGKYRFAMPLKASLKSVRHLAAFSTGEFLVAGWQESRSSSQKNQDESQAQPSQPPDVDVRTLVLSPNGDLLREVSLAEDLSAGTTAHASQSKPLLMQESAFSLGRTAPGENGEVFLMFRASIPEVYAIFPQAQVVRKVEVAPPSRDSQALKVLFSSGRGLVVQFAERGTGKSYNTALSVISVVDPQTGERLYDYQVTGEIGGSFACYAPKGLLFLWTDKDGRLVLRRVVPH